MDPIFFQGRKQAKFKYWVSIDWAKYASAKTKTWVWGLILGHALQTISLLLILHTRILLNHGFYYEPDFNTAAKVFL